MSADPGGTTVFSQGVAVNYLSTTMLSLLNIFTSTSFTPSFYAKITGSPNIAAGTYTDTLTVHWVWSICTGVNIAGACVGGSANGTKDIMVAVSLSVGQDCRISAPDVSFGSAPLVGQFSTVNQAVLVDCSKGSHYKVAFTSGNGGSARPWRTMSDGAGHSLQYNIYQPNGTTIWDETNPLPSATAGTGSTIPSQPQAYIVRINSGQITPPAGHYSDMVSVVISF